MSSTHHFFARALPALKKHQYAVPVAGAEYCGMARWPILGMGSGSWVDVSDGTVEVRSVLGFRCRFGVRDIAEVHLHEGDVATHGIHGRKGRWLINGSPKPIVVIVLSGSVRSRGLFGMVPRRVREVAVSVRAAEELIRELKPAQ